MPFYGPNNIELTLAIMQVETSASLGVVLIDSSAASLRVTTQGSIDHMLEIRLDQPLHVRIQEHQRICTSHAFEVWHMKRDGNTPFALISVRYISFSAPILLLLAVQDLILMLAALDQGVVLFHLVVESLLKLIAPYCRSHAIQV
jgi:hypothetical protein